MSNKRNLDLDIKLLRWICDPSKKLQVRRIKDEDYEYAYFLLGNSKRWKTHEIDAEPVPAFTEQLDLCIHYLAPKIDYFELHYANKAPFTSVKIKHENNEYFGVHKSPAMALCLAIEKIITNPNTAIQVSEGKNET